MFTHARNPLIVLTFACIPTLASAQNFLYITPGDTFHYVGTQASTSAAALGIDTTNFIQPGYDDSKWLTGSAPFGTESNGDFAYRTYWAVNYDPMLRKTLTLNAPVTMTVNLGVDNGFDFYVNGKHITGDNAEGYTSRWEYNFTVDASYFVAGDNVIAIALEDHGGSTAFDMQMLGPSAPSSVPEPGMVALLSGIVISGATSLLLRRRQ